jgi:hypothetical protein
VSLRTSINVRDQMSLTSVQKNRQNYCAIYFNPYTVLFRRWPETMQWNCA